MLSQELDLDRASTTIAFIQDNPHEDLDGVIDWFCDQFNCDADDELIDAIAEFFFSNNECEAF